ncbi:MAG: aminotransferase class I/II-fold pyridoxal phosphate-dependent enzyme [Anaerolineae bacterium]|nr:aminotransferase class I/II-fold pyridoxal phosphate-dependent enzyme [Anaerolineae bacterium]
MRATNPNQGLGTLAIHAGSGGDPLHAHVTPIYQTSTFSFDDSDSGAATFLHQQPGYVYTRLGNPNQVEASVKVAVLEGLDLLRQQPEKAAAQVVAGQVFATGMAAITTAILACVQAGQTIVAQKALYSATFSYLNNLLPRYGIEVVWVEDPSPARWQAALQSHPGARLVYAETPANPTMALVDLAESALVAHQHGAWLMIDNTFATPYCQRPLTLGTDVVVHSTTKYLNGHGTMVGGAIVSPHLDYMSGPLQKTLETLGGSAAPFDTWLTAIGLKTFELRMQRHCENALAVAQFLERHPAVAHVYYPGLASHPQHELAKRQMLHFGGMLAFELKGGLQAGKDMMDRVRLCTLAVSLGNVDTLISHPASMTHVTVPPEQRQKMGLSDGLVRLSVGVENVEDILSDLDQALGT